MLMGTVLVIDSGIHDQLVVVVTAEMMLFKLFIGA